MIVAEATPRYVLYEAPTNGYAELVGLAERRAVATQEELFARNRAWLLGTGPAAREYIRYDYPARPAAAGPGSPGCPGGRAVELVVTPARIDVEVECTTASTLVLKTTYHPNWRVSVDGRPEPAFMVSPSYLALSVLPGRHTVSARYEAAPLKMPLLVIAGLALFGTLALGGQVRRWPLWLRELRSRAPRS